MTDAVRTFLVVVAPLLLPFVSGQCLPSLASVQLREFNADTSVPREYILCPNAVYDVGSFDPTNTADFSGGDAFLVPRSNAKIQCGPDGTSASNCTIRGGNLHVGLTTVLGANEPAYNVEYSGLTFQDTGRYSFWGNLPGSIRFNDCIFQNHTNAYAPILLDYVDSSSNEELSVSFVKCKFLNNKYFGEPSFGAIITGNGIQNRLSFQNCQFNDNDMIFNNTMPERTSFLVETSGPLNMDLNCFSNNQVGVAPVGSYVADVDVDLNYGVNSSGTVCPFVAAFESSLMFELYSPACVAFDATEECLDYQTAAPTMSPSDAPSAVPSASPTTLAPSASPSASPTVSPTTSLAPTFTPSPTTEAPTMAPTDESAGFGISVVFSAATTATLSLWIFY